MNILVTHAYSNDNKGDAALLSVLLKDIPRAFNEATITVLTADRIEKGETFEGALVQNNFLHYVSDRYASPALQGLYGLFIALMTLSWAVIYRYTGKNFPLPRHLRKIIDLYLIADLIIPVGGGYIRANDNFRETVILFFTLHPLFFAYLINKPTINYTQSIGPFGNKVQEMMAKFALKRVQGIIARETITLNLLKKWHMDKNTLLSVDSGFLFDNESPRNLREELGIPNDQMFIGITTRNWLSPGKQEKYERAVAEFSDYAIRTYNAAIIFIPQVTVENRKDDDRESNKRAHSYMKESERAYILTERYGHGTIKAIYENLDYLIGTRFHSVIFALTSYVPSIAIAYEYKTQGIMTDLGLESWVVDIKNVKTQELINLFGQLVIKKEDYRSQLKKILPSYIARAKESILFVKDLYEKITQKTMSKSKGRKGKVIPLLLLSVSAVLSFVTFVKFEQSQQTPFIKEILPAESSNASIVKNNPENAVTNEIMMEQISKPIHTIGISAEGGLSKHDISYINNELDQMVDLGVTWIRFDIEWSHIQMNSQVEYDWKNYDVLIAAIKAHNLKPLGLVIFTPEWARAADCIGVKCPPHDPSQFAVFMAALASRYKNDIQHWEVGNEPNNVGFWASGADCKAYTSILKAVYPAVKLANPNAVILTGGLAPMPNKAPNMGRIEFLDCIYKNGGKNYFDAVADHPYTFPKLSSEGNVWTQIYLTSPSLRSIMEKNDDGSKRIWLTEVGAPTNGPDENWYVSEAKQALMIQDTIASYKKLDWAGPLFWYTLRDEGTSTSTIENFFGLKRFDGSKKPAYDILKEIIRQNI